jgi:hypothetical protein
MVSRAWCFGFGSGWGRQTCFSFALRRSKRWLPVFTNRKYSSSVRRTRGYLGLRLCYYHWRSRRFSQFSTSTPTSTPAIRTDLESFFDRSNFHTHTRTYYGHLRGTTQSSRLNEIQPSIIASTTTQNYLDIGLMISSSIQLATSSHLLQPLSRAHKSSSSARSP